MQRCLKMLKIKIIPWKCTPISVLDVTISFLRISKMETCLST